MSDASGPGSARKCPGLALADLGDTEGFEKDGEEGQLYGLQLFDWVYKRKKIVTQEGGGAQKLGGLSDMDLSYAAPRRLHTLAFTGSRRVDCGTRSRNGLACGRQSFGSLRGDGLAAQDSEGDKCWYPAVFLRPRVQKRGRFRALYPEDEQEPVRHSQNGF